MDLIKKYNKELKGKQFKRSNSNKIFTFGEESLDKKGVYILHGEKESCIKELKYVFKLLKKGIYTIVDVETTKESTSTESHYNMKIQPIEYITENNLDFVEGNIIKYVSRYKKKDGLKDLKKAKYYLDMLIDRYDKN